jgi:hypothetical protein
MDIFTIKTLSPSLLPHTENTGMPQSASTLVMVEVFVDVGYNGDVHDIGS